LWNTDLGSGISAPPITYSVDGKQYISLLVGWGGVGAATPGFIGGQHGWAYKAHRRRLVTFALDGQQALPAKTPPFFPKPLRVDGFEEDPKFVKAGAKIYVEECLICHGAGAESGGYAPDLRAAASVLDLKIFGEVVQKGSRRDQGMPGFSKMTEPELVSLQHYIRHQAALD
ncbi:MAG: quinohemoprotein ethanol dehydrogenase, partial [Gammaproteobacteria bacterium]